MSRPLYEELPGDAPIILSVPHSGTHIPADLLDRFTPAGRLLPDTDWFVAQLYADLERLGIAALIATHSRYVMDLNRPPDGAALYPGQSESALCPLASFEGERLYRDGAEPDAAEVAARIAQYWLPYHDRLARLIEACVQRHGHCLLWDAHSIRSRVPRLFADELPELNLGTFGGRSAGAELRARLARWLAAQGRFTHVIDGRFQGGYITRHYGDPGRGVQAVQLEIAQRAYMDEASAPRFDPARAAPLRALLGTLFAMLLANRPLLGTRGSGSDGGELRSIPTAHEPESAQAGHQHQPGSG